jgi:hypothetical protein
MSKRLVSLTVSLIAGVVFMPILRAQTAAPNGGGNATERDKWNSTPLDKTPENPAAAPRRDLSGIWDGTNEGGGQYAGARDRGAVLPPIPGQRDPLGQGGRLNASGGEPDESNIWHPLPYTPLGEETLKAHKPAGFGVRAVSSAVLGNDPVTLCDPQGFPRMELYQLRTIELAQTANQVIFLNQFFDVWRVIWTDQRELPKDPEPRWNGYSVGKWVDDYTFVAETVGLDERTWLDNAGRPHSDALKVQERFHRVNHDILELTVTIDDPKMYTQPWVAIDKIPLHLQPPDFDIREMVCSPSETADYNKLFGDPLAPGDKSTGK